MGKILSNQDFNKNEIQNARIQNLAADPTSPVSGQIYYNTTTNKQRTFNGTTWDESGAGAGDVSQAANSGGAGRLKVSAGLNKVITDYATAGLVKSDANGVVSAAVAGTDYVTGASINALTNKTFDANGIGNTLSNLETADFAINVIDTDTALTANSNTRIASQAATKAYIDSVAASDMTFKGGIDASTNPNYPAAVIGDMYRITVAGKIGGASGESVTVGDTLISAGSSVAGTQAAVGANWTIVQANVDAATTTTQGLTTYATNTEAEAKSLATKSLTPASVANFPIKKIFTIGDGTTAAIVVTHNLNTQDITASVRDATTNDFVLVDIKATSVNTATITFAVAPALNSYKVCIIG